MPNLARLREQGSSGSLRSVFPPLSPVAWTGVMTGKNSGKHGIFEFLEHGHDPLGGPGQLVAGDPGEAALGDRRAVRQEDGGRRRADELSAAAGRAVPGFFLGDFLSPAAAPDFTSDPALFAELEKEVGPYRPWSTAIHDGGNEAAVLDDLHAFLEQHLKADLVPDEPVRLGPVHLRPDGDRPLPARAVARLGPDASRGPGA